MGYLEYTFSGFKDEESSDILMALLDDAGYSGFLETEHQLKAYIIEDKRDENLILQLLEVLFDNPQAIRFSCLSIPETNWNEIWEKQYNPIKVKDRVLIRAPFHKVQSRYEFDLLIEPKMSFGTGHHETTRLMIDSMLSLDFSGRRVLDMGCGTGLLGILASKMGAEEVLAVDIDEWAFNNAIENSEKNSCSNLLIVQGGVEKITGKIFDVILANINRNVLLTDMKAYAEGLKEKGYLIISGILAEDSEMIQSTASYLGMEPISRRKEKNWIAITFQKNSKLT